MYPQDPSVMNHLRHQELLRAAARVRLACSAATLPAPPWSERIASARRAVGYRMVEAGLHLAVGRAAPRRTPELSSRPPP